MKKFVINDDGNTKVIIGTIQKEDEFTYCVITDTKREMIIGKRNIVFVRDL